MFWIDPFLHIAAFSPHVAGAHRDPRQQLTLSVGAITYCQRENLHATPTHFVSDKSIFHEDIVVFMGWLSQILIIFKMIRYSHKVTCVVCGFLTLPGLNALMAYDALPPLFYFSLFF